MKRWILLMLSLAVVGFTASGASAHKWAATTVVGNVEASGPANDLTVEGQVASVENDCVPRRKARIYSLEGELVDTDRTDLAGRFKGRGDFSDTPLLKVKVSRRDLPPRGRDHKHLCKGAGPEFEPVPSPGLDLASRLIRAW